MNAHQDRWIEFLSEFDFEIKHVKCKENRVIYALNRRMYLATISIRKSDLKDRILEASSKDEVYL